MRKYLLAGLALALTIALTAVPILACVGARPLAMGGAFIAVADDANAVYWNPAGLTQVQNNESTYMLTVDGGINYQWFFSNVERQGDLVFGASGINSLNGIGFKDDEGNVLAGIFDNTWYQLSFAMPIDDRLSIGGNLKFYNNQIILPDYGYAWPSEGTGLDVSILWKASDRLSVGLLTQDIVGSDFVYDFRNVGAGLQKVGMATNVRPGIAYKVDDDTTVAFDIYDLTGDTTFSVGVEERFKIGAVRAGFYHDTFTAGFGLTDGQRYSFDYVYIYDSHIISLSWAF